MEESVPGLDVSQASTQTTVSVDCEDSCDESKYENSWVRTHFKKSQNDKGDLRRFCTFPECKADYSPSISHRCLKQHWQHSHGIASASKMTKFLLHDSPEVDALLKYIIMTGAAFSTVENSWFRRYCHLLSPRVTYISRMTVMSKIIENTSKIEKMIADELSTAESISMTFDIWTARKSSRGFGAIRPFCGHKRISSVHSTKV